MNLENDLLENTTKTFEKFIKFCEYLNPHWESSSLSKLFINKTNEEVSQWHTRSSVNVDSEISDVEFFKIQKIENINGYYSNLSHQEEAFPKCLFKINNNKILGRHFISSRNICAGEVLLIELPVIKAPYVLHPLSKAKPRCVHCCRYSDTYLCKGCGFYLCRTNCKWQHEFQEECHYLSKLNLTEEQKHIQNLENKDFLSAFKSLSNEDKVNNMQTISKTYMSLIEREKESILKYYFMLPTFKTLSLISRSEIINDLITALQGDVDSTRKRHRINQKAIVNPILKMGLKYNETFIHRIADVWDINSFELNIDNTKMQALYAVTSLMAHACKSNCENYFSSNGTLVLRAVEDISVGTILTLCYTDNMWPTYIRRDHLKMSKRFICNCERCNDPTEFNTYFGHIKCESCANVGVCALFGEEMCDTAINCIKCKTTVKAANFFREEAAACKLFVGQRACDLDEYVCLINKLEETFPKRYHEKHHLILRWRIELIFNSFSTNIESFPNERFDFYEQLVVATYECCYFMPCFSQQKAKIGREFIRVWKERRRRKDDHGNTEPKMKKIISDTMLALHWEPRLPQVDLQE